MYFFHIYYIFKPEQLSQQFQHSNNFLNFNICFYNISGYGQVGVCKRDLVRKANYFPRLENIGHRNYLIDSDGGTFSHHQKEMNAIKQSFKFVENTVLQQKLTILRKRLLGLNKKLMRHLKCNCVHKNQIIIHVFAQLIHVKSKLLIIFEQIYIFKSVKDYQIFIYLHFYVIKQQCLIEIKYLNYYCQKKILLFILQQFVKFLLYFLCKKQLKSN